MVERRRNLADRIRPLRRIAGRVETLEAKWLGRSILSIVMRQPVLVLETTGRRSGKRRSTALAFREVDDVLVVVGGAGGQTAVPDWVLNLRADPNVVVTRRRRTMPMVARELAGDERTAMWDRLLPQLPMIATYEERAGRPIPVIELSEASPS
ncbi:MAG: nitroreductase family deazaflavin-dependent oxidoreductase [Actinomycetota bacterium]|nr:nitroreductase family deazaflavin-dependent oxidoreductase [Actinomycetota bacterium]